MYGTWQAYSCGCCLFWLARFTFQCKSIFFNFFWTQSSSCDYIRVSGRFTYSIKCLQAFPSFLPLLALLLAPFFRTVFDSLLLNRTETLATQARSSWKLPTAEISSVLETSVLQVPLFTHRNQQKTEGILAYVKGAIVTIFAIFLES